MSTDNTYDLYDFNDTNIFIDSRIDPRGLNNSCTYLSVAGVLLLRVGSILVQIGCIPTENVYVILQNNVIDIAVALISFGLVGFILASGGDAASGAIGTKGWIASESANLDSAIVGFSAVLIGTSIIAILLSARMHFVSYIILTLLFSAVLQPLVMHWVWFEGGLLNKQNLMKRKVSFKDHGGGVVVHLAAGTVGLVGAIFLGRRLLRLRDIHESSMGVESPGSTVIGYFFMILGLLAFSLPSAAYVAIPPFDDYSGIVVVNGILALAAGILVVTILHFILHRRKFTYWVILRCLQGALASLVAISSGVDVYSPIIAFAIAVGAALIFYLVSAVVQKTCIEDNCNAVAIHFVSSILGGLLPPFLGRKEHLGFDVNMGTRVVHFLWQTMCTFGILGLFAIFSVVFFLILHFTKLLRNKDEAVNHRRAVLTYKNTKSRRRRLGIIARLFKVGTDTKYIEPGPSQRSPETLELEQSLPKLDARKSDKRIQKEAVENSVKETETDVKAQVENDKSDQKYIHQSVKSRFIYTMVNIHNADDGNHNDGLNGGGGDIFSPKQKPNQSDIFDGKNVVRKKSHYKLHRTKKCTNLVSKLDVRKKNANDGTNEQINLTRSAECILYDKKFNDGFLTFKRPVEINDMSDDCSL